jgi:hypothetical protein
MWSHRWTVAILFVASTVLVSAGPPADQSERAIAQQLRDRDPAVRAAGVAQVRAAVDRDPAAAVGPLRRSWLAPMARAGMNDDVIQITQRAILAAPGSPVTFHTMLRARVSALIAAGRLDEALADARRYYNVCPLDQTGLAVDALVTAMEARWGAEGEAKVREFRMRQVAAAWASADASGDDPAAPAADRSPADAAAPSTAGDTAVNDPVVLAIPLDTAPYLQEAAKWASNRRQPVAYGNLLLLAGKADDAYGYFTGLLARARTDQQLATALERQAAAMRAQDGTAARAQTMLRRLAAGR